MIPSSSPKLSDLHTLSQSKLLENHTLHSNTYLYSPHIAVPSPLPPGTWATSSWTLVKTLDMTCLWDTFWITKHHNSSNFNVKKNWTVHLRLKKTQSFSLIKKCKLFFYKILPFCSLVYSVLRKYTQSDVFKSYFMTRFSTMLLQRTHQIIETCNNKLKSI